MTGYYPGSIDLASRAERVPNLNGGAGQDRRTGDQYRAALARETEASLRRSASWRNGCPLLEEERWPTITSSALGGRGDRPDKGRWA
jgi:hypothetical protein